MKQFNHQQGFTIVEVLVTSFIFSIIALTVSGIFIQTLGVERRTFASQKIQENGLFIMELMSREIRVSQIVDTNQSPVGDSLNCTLTRLTIQHPVNGVVTYSLVSGVLQRTVGAYNVVNGVLQPTGNGVTTNISSSDVTFSRLNFCLMGSGPTDKQQARVTILATIQNKTGKEILSTSFETTVSSRDVSTEF